MFDESESQRANHVALALQEPIELKRRTVQSERLEDVPCDSVIVALHRLVATGCARDPMQARL